MSIPEPEFVHLCESCNAEPAEPSGRCSKCEANAGLGPAVAAEEWFDKTGFVPAKLGRLAEEIGHLRVGPDRGLWRYRDGVYSPDGDEWLAQFLRHHLGDEFRKHRVSEVMAWCKASLLEKIQVDPSTEFINVANGLLYWREDPPRLADHTPDIASAIQLPVEWRPEAKCSAVASFLESALPEEDYGETVAFLLAWIGYCLVPEAPYKKALLLVGPTDSGKSTLLTLMENLLGHDNVSHASLQVIAENAFAGADLHGKLANIAADLDAKAPKSAGVFKQLVGGTDTIRVEKKYRDAFSFRPFAKLMFSANEPPGTSDQSDAFYGRWFILPMGRQKRGSDKIAGLDKRMSTPTELSGLLNLAVEELRRLDRRKQFAVPQAMTQAVDDYRARTDTVVGFVEERCVLHDPKDRTRSSTVFADYTEWCDRNNRHALGAGRFREHLGDVYPTVVFHKKLGGYPTWAGIRLLEPGEEMGSLGDPQTPIMKAVSQ